MFVKYKFTGSQVHGLVEEFRKVVIRRAFLTERHMFSIYVITSGSYTNDKLFNQLANP